MLWRKHWREVRWLTVLSAAGLFALGWYMLNDVGAMRQQYVPPSADGLVPATYALRRVSFSSAGPFVMAALPMALLAVAILLGIGGLGYERNAGTSLFTLSLPFTRRRLMVNRFLLGAAMVVAFAISGAAGTAGWAEFRGVGGDFPPSRALGVATCLASVALAIYAFAFLAANVTAHAVRSIATVVMMSVALVITLQSPQQPPDRWTLAWILGPLDFAKLASSDHLIRSGSMPWLSIAFALALAAGLLAATVRWVERYDF